MKQHQIITSSDCPGRSRTHYYWFDWIRFLAALICVECHVRESLLDSSICWQNGAWYSPLLYYVTHLSTQVYSFFILSGFLVGGKTIELIRQNTFRLKDYVIDRGVRIYLPFIPALLFAVATKAWVGLPQSVVEVVGNLLPLQRIVCGSLIAPFWTLPYEIWDYIVMGCVAYFFTSRRNKPIAFACIVFSVVILWILGLVFFSYWLLGAFSYFLVVKKSRFQLFLLIAAILFLEVMLLFPEVVFSGIPRLEDGFSDRWVLYAFTFLFGLLLKQVQQFQPTTRFMIWVEQVGSRLGVFSYTLYLMHIPFLMLMEKMGFPYKRATISGEFFFYWFIETLICVLCCYLMYLLIEKHTSKVKQYIRKHV